MRFFGICKIFFLENDLRRNFRAYQLLSASHRYHLKNRTFYLPHFSDLIFYHSPRKQLIVLPKMPLFSPVPLFYFKFSQPTEKMHAHPRRLPPIYFLCARKQTRVQMMQKALKLKKAPNQAKLKFLPFFTFLSKFCKFSFYKSI